MNSESNGIISVIVRTHNEGSLVEKAIESVFCQTLPQERIEVVVVDDGSTDETLRILEQFGQKIKLYRLKHVGAVAALNVGVSKAIGDFFTILDSDDFLESCSLAALVSGFERNQKAFFFYGDYFEWKAESKRLISTEKNIFNTLAAGVLFKRSIVLELGGYDSSLFFPEYDLLIKLLKHHAGIYVPYPVYNYVRGRKSLTSNRKRVDAGIEQLYLKYGKRFPIRDYE